MEDNSLSLRIIQDLDTIFRNNSYIDEFDVIPAEDTHQNKSPVLFLDNKLALQSWCVSHVYLYAYSQFLRHKDNITIDSESMLSWTRALLLINPDVLTAWNTRKQLLKHGKLRSIDEMQFSELVLTRKPKSVDVFAHRKWLLEKMKDEKHSSLQMLLMHEIDVCAKASSRYPRNYNAWSHRIWIIENFKDHAAEIVLHDLHSTEEWIQSHVSDYSGFHYRQFLFDKMKAWITRHENSLSMCQPAQSLLCIDDYRHNLTKEIAMLNDLMLRYPAHESLWCHRRYVLSAVLSSVQSCNSESCSLESQWKQTSDKNVPEGDWCSVVQWCSVEKEEAFIVSCSKIESVDNWQQELIKRHLKWLQNVLGWFIVLL